jgi:aryl-alcohol dehydrogenase-like predicted oxidoreductase
MQRRKLSSNGLEVSELCLGTMTFGNPVAQADAIALVHAALDKGINFIDTADIYEGYDRYMGSPGGVAETILGKALKGRRERVIVTTKAGNPVALPANVSSGGQPTASKGLSRKHLETQINSSLRRLATDYIDVFEFHRPDSETPVEESVETVLSFVKAGKVRHWGLSNYDGVQIRDIVRLCEGRGWQRPVVLQPPYSWLKRDIEAETLPACVELNIAVTPYQPLQGGLLTGKYTGNSMPSNSRAAESQWLKTPDETLKRRLEEFEAEARNAGMPAARYALRWLLNQPGVASVVVGVKSIAQLEQLV